MLPNQIENKRCHQILNPDDLMVSIKSEVISPSSLFFYLWFWRFSTCGNFSLCGHSKLLCVSCQLRVIGKGVGGSPSGTDAVMGRQGDAESSCVQQFFPRPRYGHLVVANYFATRVLSPRVPAFPLITG